MPEPINEQVRARLRMQKVRDTKPELDVRRVLHRMGLRYRLDTVVEPDVRSKADIVFRSARVAVFMDGCFWHGCPEHFVPPKNNAGWWIDKIRTNQERDVKSRAALAARGWTILAFWEHEPSDEIAKQVEKAVRGGRGMR